MLEVKNLTKIYNRRKILDGVSLSLEAGEVVGLIGRSGAGKSTLARCLVGLETPDCGDFTLANHKLDPGRGQARKDVQYLWQDASQSLSPYLSAHGAVLETLNGFSIGKRAFRPDTARQLLLDLGIETELQSRRPHALSGGQCQRVALARALAARPKLLILDEPLSALDLVTQNRTVDLLQGLHQTTDLSMLIVSHDLAPLKKLSSRILLLQQAKLIEKDAIAHFLDSRDKPDRL